MTYDRSWLEAAFLSPAPPRLLLFWGHQPAKDGRIAASCFSQWWVAPFTVDGAAYPTAEHWMMAAKARLFGDVATEKEILAADTPKRAKDLGRSVRGFDEAVWDREKRAIVAEGSYQKFNQNKDLGTFLLGTGDQVLVEASLFDRVWGIGLAASDEKAADPHLWRGENLLGFALMGARDRLRSAGG